MNESKAFKFIAGAMLVIAMTVYSQTTEHLQGAAVFLISATTFLVGYFAGEDV
jgi:hypothetical protein